jgi:DNA-binding response OmpR family regulator
VRVLIVEDEWQLAAALQRGLEAEGFTVDVAHDRITGLRQATRSPTTSSCSTSCCRA